MTLVTGSNRWGSTIDKMLSTVRYPFSAYFSYSYAVVWVTVSFAKLHRFWYKFQLVMSKGKTRFYPFKHSFDYFREDFNMWFQSNLVLVALSSSLLLFFFGCGVIGKSATAGWNNGGVRFFLSAHGHARGTAFTIVECNWFCGTIRNIKLGC